jgi:hypothetical protein
VLLSFSVYSDSCPRKEDFMATKFLCILLIAFFFQSSLLVAQMGEVVLPPVGVGYYDVLTSGENRGAARVAPDEINRYISWGNQSYVGGKRVNSRLSYQYARKLGRNIIVAKAGKPRVVNQTILVKNVTRVIDRQKLISIFSNNLKIGKGKRKTGDYLLPDVPSKGKLVFSVLAQGYGFWIIKPNGNVIPQVVKGIKAHLAEVELSVEVYENGEQKKKVSLEAKLNENGNVVSQKSSDPSLLYLSSGKFIRTEEIILTFKHFLYSELYKNAMRNAGVSFSNRRNVLELLLTSDNVTLL